MKLSIIIICWNDLKGHFRLSAIDRCRYAFDRLRNHYFR